jgi:hypothetical protein
VTRRRAPRGGFVLVEALATLAIGAMIIAALAALIVSVMRLADRTANGLETLETTGRALATVEREIRFAARARLAGDAKRSFIFAGSNDRILFTVDREEQDGLKRTYAVSYQSKTVDGVVRLFRAEAPVPPGLAALDAIEMPDPTELYAGPAGIRFSYFEPQADGSGEILTDRWDKEDKLPSAVRLALTVAEGGAVLDTLRVPLVVDGEPGCAAPQSAFCSHADSSGGDDSSGSSQGGTAPPAPEGEAPQ